MGIFAGDSSPPFLFANAFKAAALISASICVLVHAGGAEAEVADEVSASVLTSATPVADRLRFRLPPALPLTSSSFGSAFARGRSDLLGFGVHPAGKLDSLCCLVGPLGVPPAGVLAEHGTLASCGAHAADGLSAVVTPGRAVFLLYCWAQGAEG